MLMVAMDYDCNRLWLRWILVVVDHGGRGFGSWWSITVAIDYGRNGSIAAVVEGHGGHGATNHCNHPSPRSSVVTVFYRHNTIIVTIILYSTTIIKFGQGCDSCDGRLLQWLAANRDYHFDDSPPGHHKNNNHHNCAEIFRCHS